MRYISNVILSIATFVFIATNAVHARNVQDLLQLPHAAEKKHQYAGALSHDEALSLYSSKQKNNSFEACKDQFPKKRPLDLSLVPVAMKPLALCSNNFAVLYSQLSKAPVVVVERLTAAQIQDAKGEERTNQFYPDPRIPQGARAELSDFKQSPVPVDRGHQAPAGNMPDPHAMAQSFALSNMIAQDPTNNRKIWNKVETDVRKFAKRAEGAVFVFTGPIFDPGHETIGANKVWKPTRIFKLVFDEASGRAWAYVLPNAETRIERPIDYASFVQTTGLRLLDGVTVTGTAGKNL